MNFSNIGKIFRTNCLAGLREEGDLLDFQLDFRKRLQQCSFGFVKLAGGRKYRQAASFAFDLVDIDVGIQHRFEHLLFVVPFER